MVSSKMWIPIAVSAVIVSLLVSGCGGGSGGDGTPTAKVGNVSGRILDYLTSSPLGGVVVTIDGKSATSDGNGYFTVRGVSPGTQVVAVLPNEDTNLVMPPGAGTLTVVVYADETVQLANTVYLWDRSDIPPDPPITAS